ncbi:spermatogenesis-defective protein 39 homolog isoform X10 [Centroberyx affinis]|uniref:spermatogenesis-defective protein 39 homolog isoform X10 n=1 Tax=Centroberyx affinis TaxID=166261 RepID=UPI003A5BF586
MMKSKADEEDYWNSSKFKAFTFDDEDDEFTRLKESKQAVNSIRSLVEEEDDEDDVEKVSWSGEPIGSISWSVRETASREQSFPKINTEPSLPKSNSGYSLSSLFKGKAKAGGFQSFSESLSDSSVRHYAPELRKPKSEYKDYISDWSPEETVQRMQQGKVFSLEKFRSLQDKLLLLDQAVRVHDGNVITAVLIYLKKSLSKEVLFRELESRQTALRHFIHYLTETKEQRLLMELFSLPFSPEDAVHVQDHFTLLERQIIIEATDGQAESGGKVEIFQKFPRRASILNMPLITTLYYCCFYHYSETEGTYSSPANIRQTFRVLQQYVGLVDDAELKISLAQKHKCHDIVINTYRDLKDRQLLLGYRGKVGRGSAEERKIDELLSNSQIRWKN